MNTARLFRLNNMKKNKKGISQVVATVLIIMITVAAVAMLAGFIVPFVKNSLQKSTECMPYQGYYLFDESFGYNCYNRTSNLYAVSIKSSFDKSLAGNIMGIKVVFSDKSGATRVVEIKNSSIISRSERGIWIAGSHEDLLRIPGPGGIITYVYNASAGDVFITAEVYPVLKSERICADLKESINLKSCEKQIG